MPSTWPPDSGSVTAIVGRQLAGAKRGQPASSSVRSLPKWTIFATPSWEAWTIAPIAPLTRDSSSMMMVLARWPSPMPPCVAAIVTPSQPCPAISRASSTSTARRASSVRPWSDLVLGEPPDVVAKRVVLVFEEVVHDRTEGIGTVRIPCNRNSPAREDSRELQSGREHAGLVLDQREHGVRPVGDVVERLLIADGREARRQAVELVPGERPQGTGAGGRVRPAEIRLDLPGLGEADEVIAVPA